MFHNNNIFLLIMLINARHLLAFFFCINCIFLLNFNMKTRGKVCKWLKGYKRWSYDICNIYGEHNKLKLKVYVNLIITSSFNVFKD